MRILVTGASGQLGSYLLRELSKSTHSVVAWSGTATGSLFGTHFRPVPLDHWDAVASAFREARPDAIIHAAAIGSIAACHADPARATRVNTLASGQLAQLCADSGSRLLYVSTDLVFDGEHAPYNETISPHPLSQYGRSKAAAEQVVLRHGAQVVRVSLLFGPTLTGKPTFFDQQWTALRDRKSLLLFEDEWRTPLSMATAARELCALVESEFLPREGRPHPVPSQDQPSLECEPLPDTMPTAESGSILHLGGPERMSRLEMGRRLAESLGADASLLVASRRDAVAAPEPRPRDTSLDSTLWRTHFPDHPWPTWNDAVAELGISS